MRVWLVFCGMLRASNSFEFRESRLPSDQSRKGSRLYGGLVL